MWGAFFAVLISRFRPTAQMKLSARNLYRSFPKVTSSPLISFTLNTLPNDILIASFYVNDRNFRVAKALSNLIDLEENPPPTPCWYHKYSPRCRWICYFCTRIPNFLQDKVHFFIKKPQQNDKKKKKPTLCILVWWVSYVLKRIFCQSSRAGDVIISSRCSPKPGTCFCSKVCFKAKQGRKCLPLNRNRKDGKGNFSPLPSQKSPVVLPDPPAGFLLHQPL